MSAPDRDGRDGRDEADTARARVCISLKTKMYYVAGWEHEEFEPSATAQYWCLQTMRAVGPDESQVHPENCCGGRGCFTGEG